MRYLGRAADVGVPLVGVCTGTFVLHRAGLMQGYRACVSWFHHDDFLERFDGLEPVSDQIFVVDRDRLTCSGGVSSAHLAAFIVERHLGRARAAKSLRIMIIDAAMAAEEPQPGMPLALATEDALVRKALLRHAAVDRRAALDRAGGVRLEVEPAQARAALPRGAGDDPAPGRPAHPYRAGQAPATIDPPRSATQIAADTGFCDLPHLIRVFRAAEGMTPEAFRMAARSSARDASW